MHYAVSHGNFDVVSILLDSKVCNINRPNAAGYTCVMLVSLAQVRSETHRQVIRRLFQLADVNVRAKQVCKFYSFLWMLTRGKLSWLSWTYSLSTLRLGYCHRGFCGVQQFVPHMCWHSRVKIVWIYFFLCPLWFIIHNHPVISLPVPYKFLNMVQNHKIIAKPYLKLNSFWWHSKLLSSTCLYMQKQRANNYFLNTGKFEYTQSAPGHDHKTLQSSWCWGNVLVS